MNMDHALTDHIRQQLRLGHKDHARLLLDEALNFSPDHPEHLYLRGILNASVGANQSALVDFNAALRHAPDLPPILFNRGLVLFRMERLAEALQDFLVLSRIQPENADVWTNIGIIHSRDGRPLEALECLRRAHFLSPSSLLILRTLANALRDAGQFDHSMRIHRKVIEAAPNDAAALTDFALCLLSLGDIVGAREHYTRALSSDPSDQTALAGIYMTSNELDEQATVSSLMDYDTLLNHSSTQASESINLDILGEMIMAHENLIWEPAGRSTKAGKQSPMLDQSPESHFDHVHQMLKQQLEQRMHEFIKDTRLQSHPWMNAMPRRWRLQSWVTILEQGGQQTPHIHPAGWLSGVLYVDVGQPCVENAGNLMFGRVQPDIPLKRPAHEYQHRPINGQLVTFPSYFFHNTIPYSGDRPRISLAFDLIPD